MEVRIVRQILGAEYRVDRVNAPHLAIRVTFAPPAMCYVYVGEIRFSNQCVTPRNTRKRALFVRASLVSLRKVAKI